MKQLPKEASLLFFLDTLKNFVIPLFVLVGCSLFFIYFITDLIHLPHALIKNIKLFKKFFKKIGTIIATKQVISKN